MASRDKAAEGTASATKGAKDGETLEMGMGTRCISQNGCRSVTGVVMVLQSDSKVDGVGDQMGGMVSEWGQG